MPVFNAPGHPQDDRKPARKRPWRRRYSLDTMKTLLVRSLLLVLGGLLFFAVVGIGATWAPDQPVEALKARWAPPPSQFIDVDGLQVHLRDEGPRGVVESKVKKFLGL